MQSGYWNKVAEQKSFGHPFNLAFFSSLVKCDERVIDLGCGYGRITAELQQAGYQNLLGIDTSVAMLARAAREHAGIEFRHSEDAAISEPSESVDAVILFAVLTSIPDDEDQASLIRECRRVLRAGGVLYVSDLYLNDDARNLSRYDKYQDEFGVRGVFRLDDGGVMRHHSEEWIGSLLADFEPLLHEQFSAQTMNGNTSRAFQFVGRRRPPSSAGRH